MMISVIRTYAIFMKFSCKLVLLFSLVSSHFIPSLFFLQDVFSCFTPNLNAFQLSLRR